MGDVEETIVAIEKEVRGPRKTKGNKEWMTKETLQMMDKRRSYDDMKIQQCTKQCIKR